MEKKPLTLEKDKKDQSKYYISYPKLLALDMKWENCFINVVGRSNIRKYSKLDDIVTPVRLLESFLDDVLVDMIAGYTKLYSHREKVEISF